VPVVNARELEKAFGDRRVLGGVDVTLVRAERVGLVGDNGSGKSTLARILAGIEPPDRGVVEARRGARILYLEQVPTFSGEPTAREVVVEGLGDWHRAWRRHQAASAALGSGRGDVEALLGEQELAATDVVRLGGWERMHQVEAILGHLGISDPDVSVGRLSGGERRRVSLAGILVARPDLAILDEPTNHLDAETIEWLEVHLQEDFAGAVLLITHDRYLLDRVAVRTLELSEGRLYSYAGGYREYLEAKAERLALAARTEANRQNFLRGELEWLRRQPKARTTKQRARIDRAEAALDAPPPVVDRSVELGVTTLRTGKTVLTLRGLELEMAAQRLVAALDLTLLPGERIGVIGKNGVGKTTLLRAIAGEIAPSAGAVELGRHTHVAYFDQERGDLDDAASVWDNVVGDQSKIELDGRPIDPYAYLDRFLFRRHALRQKVGSLSGGERARVALARLLRRGCNLLLLDEPTNDLDVATLGAVESLLVEFGGTVLVVTHDRWFLDRVATSILAFEGEGRVVRYPGNYASYCRLRAEAEAQRVRPAAEPKRASPSTPPRKQGGLTWAEARELETLVDRVSLAEAEVTRLVTELGDHATYSKGTDVVALRRSLETARAEVDRLTARWEELETRRG
jgi:ABC transport system ATP-binding/permease protein